MDDGCRQITERQRRGAWAEEVAAGYLADLGWRVVARNVRIGRDEIDLLAIEPISPPTLVLVEVRGLHATRFGAPEERVDGAKVRRLYRAAAALRGADAPPGGARLRILPWRVDLVVVDARGGAPRLRHLRAVEPP